MSAGYFAPPTKAQPPNMAMQPMVRTGTQPPSSGFLSNQMGPNQGDIWHGPAAQQSSFGFSQNSAPSAPSVNNIQTSITPQPIYSPGQTQQAVNLAHAQASQLADPRWQTKQFSRPGLSVDAGTYGAAMPGISDALSQGNMIAGQIPLQDYISNQGNMLSGQVSRENEGLGWGGLMAQLYGQDVGNYNRNLSSGLGVLSQLMV